MADYSQAPNQQMGDFDLIPDGTLAWAYFAVRPFNLDQGLIEKESQTTPGNKYLDCELTIAEGEFARKKVWTIIGVAGAEKFVNMGGAQIRAILECGRGAGPGNPAGYVIDDDFGQFWDENRGAPLRVAVKIGIEKGKDGYKDKNTVKAFLSPNPEASSHKDYLALMAGQTVAKPAASKPAAAAAPSWGNPAAAQPTAQPATQPAVARTAAPAKPNWGAPQTTAAPQPAGQPAQHTGAKPAWLQGGGQ